MKYQKGFAPIILLCIVVILGVTGASYFYLTQNKSKTNISTNTQDKVTPLNHAKEETPTSSSESIGSEKQTINLVTYKNFKYKYSIQYPQSWYICYNAKALQDSDSVCFTPEKPPTEEAGGAPLGITVSTRSKSAGLDSSSYTKHWLSENDPNAKLKETNPSYMPGIDATIVNGLMGAGTPGPAAFIVRNPQDQNVIQVWSEISYGTEQEKLFNEDILRQILSTFKFN